MLFTWYQHLFSPRRVNFSLHPPKNTSVIHLKFLTGNFIIGRGLLCFNGSVDKKLCEDNSLFPFLFPWP